MAACKCSMIDYRRRSKEEAQRPEPYSLGQNCVLIRVLSLTQVRLKLGYLAWVLCGFEFFFGLLCDAEFVKRETRKIRRSRNREKRRGWISRLQVIGRL